MASDEGRILTPTLIRAARALLDLDQEGLAQATGISRKTLALIETTTSMPTDPRRIRMLQALRETLETDLDVEFIFEGEQVGEGLRLRKPRPSR
jgi:DNA-binding XRE family transcriptional regulator